MSAPRSGVRARDLIYDARLIIDRFAGVADLLEPVMDATCDNPLQRRMLETLAASLECFANEALRALDRIEAETCPGRTAQADPA